MKAFPDSHQVTEEALRNFEEIPKKISGNCQEIVTGGGSSLSKLT
jgi:hypothetical protein